MKNLFSMKIREKNNDVKGYYSHPDCVGQCSLGCSTRCSDTCHDSCNYGCDGTCKSTCIKFLRGN